MNVAQKEQRPDSGPSDMEKQEPTASLLGTGPSALCSHSLTAFVPAFVTAQAKFGPALKTARNAHYGNDYTPLDAAIAAVLPSLNAHGLALIEHIQISHAGVVELHTRVYHVSGEWIGSAYPILPTKSDPQGFGSAITYARRYCVMALLGIAPEDDDGNAASAIAPRTVAPAQRLAPARTPAARPRAASTPAVPPPLSEDELAELEAVLRDQIADAATLPELAAVAARIKTTPETLRNALRAPWQSRHDTLTALARDAADLETVGSGGEA